MTRAWLPTEPSGVHRPARSVQIFRDSLSQLRLSRRTGRRDAGRLGRRPETRLRAALPVWPAGEHPPVRPVARLTLALTSTLALLAALPAHAALPTASVVAAAVLATPAAAVLATPSAAVLATPATAGIATATASDFLPAEQAFPLTVIRDAAQAGAPVQLHWRIAPGYYLYRDRIVITSPTEARATDDEGKRAVSGAGPVEKPPGTVESDPNFGPMSVYRDDVTVTLPHPGVRQLKVSWQGCAEAGLCYPPLTRTIELGEAPAPSASPAPCPPSSTTGGTVDRSDCEAPGAATPRAAIPRDDSSDGRFAQLLGERPLWQVLPTFVLLGIGLAFTPCMLPMLPILSGLIVGNRAGPRRATMLSLVFVLAMAATYAMLGAAAALAGTHVQAWLQASWAPIGFALIFVGLAAAMFDLYTLQLPAVLRDRLDAASRRRQGGTFGAAAMLGLLSALMVGPCMTAPLAGTLLYIGQTGQVAHGALALFSLGMGMGLPLLTIVVAGARCLPRPGPWMNVVKTVFGFVMLATALWIAQPAIPPALGLALWGVLLTGIAMTLLRRRDAADTGGPAAWPVIGRSAAMATGLWGAAMMLGAAAGNTNPWQPLHWSRSTASDSSYASDTSGTPPTDASPAASRLGDDRQAARLDFLTVTSPAALQARLADARRAGKPALVDFSAQWCVACKRLDRDVFGDPAVRQALADTVLMRADVTADNDDERALLGRFQVLGPPTVMLFDPDGRERRDARLTGEFDAAVLLRRVSAHGNASPARTGAADAANPAPRSDS